MRVVVVDPPAPIVTVEKAKEHLRVLDGGEDALIEALVAAATAHIDGPQGWLGRAIGEQTLEMFLPAFGCVPIALPYPPAIDVLQVEYLDVAGETVLLGGSSYELRGNILRPAWPGAWPVAAWRGSGGETVRIRYRAGYAPAPAPIRAAILLMVGDLFAYRETAVTGLTTAEVPTSATVKALLEPFRVFV